MDWTHSPVNAVASSSSPIQPAPAVASLLRLQDLLTRLLTAADSRPTRRKTPASANVGACDGCRKVKSKCDGTEGVVCTRCAAIPGAACVYATYSKRGRKNGPMSQVSLLQESQHELEEALSHLERIPSSPVHLQDPPQWLAPSLPVVRERFGTLSGFEGLSTPLEILAACSMSSERLRGKDQDAGAAARDVYYGPNLNSSYQDADPALDPVNVGLLTEADFDRLLALYYAHLRPFFFHLDPRIHTAAYLRAASPFLSTAICATAAKFCPLASGILQQLTDHAVTLSLRVVSNGFKSVEIVHALCFMQHWASPAESWSRDKSWTWLGSAIRIATEIRLDKKLTRANENMSDEEYELLDQDAERTWQLLYAAEISLSVQTGRPASLNGYAHIRGIPHAAPNDPSQKDYDLHATVTLRRILSRALDRLPGGPEDTDREAFNQQWRTELAIWLLSYSNAALFVQILYLNTQIILLLCSLQFRGPSKGILQECRCIAATVAAMAIAWPAETGGYASNFAVINIAYGGTLLLRLIRLERSDFDPVDEASALLLCSSVADTLQTIGLAQLHRASLASHLSTRMHALVAQHRHSPISLPHTRASSPLPQPASALAQLPLAPILEFAGETELGFDFGTLFSFDQYVGEGEGDGAFGLGKGLWGEGALSEMGTSWE